jgi:nucleoside-diphosphate-sugar epimerase
MKQKRALCLGAGGFISSHLVKKLKKDGWFVRGADLKYPDFSKTEADEFIIGDLRNQQVCDAVFDGNFDVAFMHASTMGGALFIFTNSNDAEIMQNSAMINLNTVDRCVKYGIKKVFLASSACAYGEKLQKDINNPNCAEHTIWDSRPDSRYGIEKLFAEEIYMAYKLNKGLDVKIGRYHNIMGEESTWKGGKEKYPAAICRKVAEAKNGDTIEVIGPGTQTRSFLYIDECLEGTLRLMHSDFCGPVNIGSEEMISVNDLAKMVIKISGKDLKIVNVSGPVGVNGRNSNNKLIKEKLNWEPTQKLEVGMKKLYGWIEEQVKNGK